MSIEKCILFLCVSYRGGSVAFSDVNLGPRTLSGAFSENENQADKDKGTQVPQTQHDTRSRTSFSDVNFGSRTLREIEKEFEFPTTPMVSELNVI